MTILPVIMAGGTGSRLWPLSRELYPKQFLSFGNEYTMLQTTIKRLDGLTDNLPLVLCNEEHRFLAAEQLRQLDKLNKNLILEPYVRNTAPAIAIAALHVLSSNGDTNMLVLAADHIIQNTEAFHKTVQQAVIHSEQGKLVTFGIVPNAAETGYGYIKKGAAIGDAFEISAFVEKPNLSLAEQYFKSKDYLWNSGMFMFKASRYLEELNKFRPDILRACEEAYVDRHIDNDFMRIDEKLFYNCPSDSIDYAVMEKTASAVVSPLDAGWNDIGSWSALLDISDKDTNGNYIKGDVLSMGCKDSYIYSESMLVAALGLKDTIIVQTKDAILVADRYSVQNVKKIVESLKEQAREEHITHREVLRPWGKFDAIGHGERYKVKCITVAPGQKLSLQSHKHRSEHWVVVRGIATITKDNELFTLNEDQSVYIPQGVRHSLENKQSSPLVIIEVQSGSYLGEDDIIRFEDKYGRL